MTANIQILKTLLKSFDFWYKQINGWLFCVATIILYSETIETQSLIVTRYFYLCVVWVVASLEATNFSKIIIVMSLIVAAIGFIVTWVLLYLEGLLCGNTKNLFLFLFPFFLFVKCA